MIWVYIAGGVLLFGFSEVLLRIYYARYPKSSELLSVAVFLLCAWLLTEDDFFVSATGWVLLAIAVLLDIRRRKRFIIEYKNRKHR